MENKQGNLYSGTERVNFINKMGSSLTKWSLKYIPDPSIFAVILTFVAFILGMTIAKQGPMEMVQHWYKGFWSLLTFSMQMALMVITAATVANAPMAKNGIKKLASIPKTCKQAVYMVTLVSIITSILHWGLSLIIAALLAKEIAKVFKMKKVPFEYGLIGAGAYVGQMTWHGGLSASIGLLIASPGHFLESEMGIISMSDYMLNPMNLIIYLALLIFPPLFAVMMLPKKTDDYQELSPETLEVVLADDDVATAIPQNASIGDKMNHSKVICFLLGILGWAYIIYHFITKGFDLNLNIVNSIFLFSGILMHRTVANYVLAVKKATGGVSGIIFQFPLYAGIMGMIRYSGLVTVFANGLVDISTPFTFPLWTFLFASVVNMFVPSGGGQWAVQGPIVIKAAHLIDANIIKTSLAVAYGNTWTNMFQPFWAIALLGITGLKARNIMGYSISIMILSGFIFILGVLLLPV